MAEFPTTQWSLVLALKGADSLRCSEALSALCGAYWYPLYAFARRRGYPHEEAADLTQAFFLQLIEKETFQQADAALGRLRSFLLTSFRNFLANVHDHGRALKRGGTWLRVEFDPAALANRYDRAQPNVDDPERVYLRQWALTVLSRAMEALKAQETERGRSREFEQLSPLLTGDASAQGYRHAAAALGKSEGALRVELHRLRRRFARVLRQEVAATVASSGDVDEELRALLEVLA
jgi:RNA polymerase sigma factor (sigma-70 family)